MNQKQVSDDADISTSQVIATVRLTRQNANMNTLTKRRAWRKNNDVDEQLKKNNRAKKKIENER